MESYLISVAMKSTILLAAGALILRLLRGQSAAVRHLVCLATLPSAAAVMLLTLWSPQWSLLISVQPGSGGLAGGNSLETGLSSWPAALAAVWALGAFALIVRTVGGWIVLSRARRRSAHFHHSNGAEIRIADVSTPMTCGVFRPLILLPENARDWDPLRLRAVLLHEAAHVRRRDCMAKYVAQVTRALLWWNPLTWMVAARLNYEQELACDDVVLAAGVPADAYATILLDVARDCSSSLALGCAMAANQSASVLQQRFAHLFEWRPGANRSTRRTAIAIPMLLLSMTTISFAEKIYKLGAGITSPAVLEKNEPQYTNEARAAKIEGKVGLTIVVGIDQRAHDIHVTKSLDPGLDGSAAASIQTWRFQPGMKNGKPVPVRAAVEVNFRLR